MILQVVTDTDRRGAQVFAVDLGDSLTAMGREVRTVALAPGQSSRTLDLPVLGRRRLAWQTLRALRREIIAADVVVGHGSSTLLACALSGTFTKVPFVYRQISDSLFWASTPLRRLRVRAALMRASAVVALWSGSAATMQQHFGVDPWRLSIIPNGVPASRFPPPGPSDAGKPTEPVVLYLGALAKEKGVDTAIDAIAHLPDARLTIFGAGPERRSLENLATLVAAGRVDFFDPIDDPATAYAAADVLVLPSRGGDSMPGVLIEAGMMGLPCVSTPVQAIVEIVIPGATGELVPWDSPSALAAGIRSALAQANQYGPAAREHCMERFEIGVVGAAWDTLLARVQA